MHAFDVCTFMLLGYTSINTLKDAGHDPQIDFPTHKQNTTQRSM